MFKALSRYADFQGRSRRSEFWLFILLSCIIYGIGYVVMGMGVASTAAVSYDADGMPVAQTASMGALGFVGLAIIVLWWLISIIPTIAVTVRRLHDQDKTGWLALLNFVPIGNIVLLVFMFLEGTRGPNQYGPDPKGGY